jgi:hypothetical protein
MDMNGYVLELMVRQQIAERHAGAARLEMLRSAAPPRRPLRIVIGLALIRLGTWTLGNTHRRLATSS